jgi:hypothetical protein
VPLLLPGSSELKKPTQELGVRLLSWDYIYIYIYIYIYVGDNVWMT